MIVFEIGLSTINAPIPTPIKGLVILDPINTPKLISFDFFLIPSIAVVNSGNPVAIPIIKTPIMLCSIDNIFDKLTAYLTIVSALIDKKVRPINK